LTEKTLTLARSLLAQIEREHAERIFRQLREASRAALMRGDLAQGAEKEQKAYALRRQWRNYLRWLTGADEGEDWPFDEDDGLPTAPGGREPGDCIRCTEIPQGCSVGKSRGES
jgi:hypothetical protein